MTFVNAIPHFHAILNELMRHLGFPSMTFGPEQAAIGLVVDERFTLSFELIDESCWLMLADLGPSDLPCDLLCDTPPQPRRLRDHPLQVGDWQPMLALDDNHHLTCALLLPLHGNPMPSVLDGFDLLVSTAEQILDGTAFHLDNEHACLPDIPDQLPPALQRELAVKS